MALHWITAVLVVILWTLGQTIDWFPKGSARIGARSTHICVGALLALVLAWRISWRFGGGARLAPAGSRWFDAIATLTHRLLYVLLVGTVALGVANAWVRGDSILGLSAIPAFDPGNRGLQNAVESLHALCANSAIAVAGLHAAAALFHHYVLKDDVLRRMLPR
jgi:cytochrome b561